MVFLGKLFAGLGKNEDSVESSIMTTTKRICWRASTLLSRNRPNLTILHPTPEVLL